MTEVTQDYANRFGGANARIDKLIWIPGAVGCCCISEDLREMVDDLYDHNEQIISRLPEMREILTGEGQADGEYVAEVLCHVDGFFAQMARPIPTMLGSRQAYSWGYYQTEWVYAETLEELAVMTEAFSERVVAAAVGAPVEERA